MPESVDNRWKKIIDATAAVVAIAMVAYQLVSSRLLLVSLAQHQNIHLAFALTMVFLVAAAGSHKLRQKLLWLALIGITLVGTVYIHVFEVDLSTRAGIPTNSDAVVGGILLAAVLIATTKLFGVSFATIASVSVVYALVGHLLPEPFHTFHFAPKYFIFLVTTSLSYGMFGTLLSISANYLFLIIVFGVLLQISGATRCFNEIGKLAGMKLSGGAGLSSVVTSCLFGTVSGSAEANIVTTGSFTIPLMKKVGYRPYQAAAIEATSSNGGPIVPPIMGAAAFIMAEWLGVPYIRIVVIAIIPALLYFFSAGLYVQLQAMRMKISPIPEAVDYREMLLTAPLFFIPMAVLTVLMVQYFSLATVSFWTIITVVVVALIRKKTRPSLRQWVEGFITGAKLGAGIAILLALIGVITGVMTHTGLAIKLPAMVETWSGGKLYPALVISAIIALFLGMGLPGIAVYVIVALAVAPALVRMGVAMEQAHFFAFYYGVMAHVTPPIAVASLVASRLAGAPFYKTAIEATKVALAGFLIPLFFFMSPVILLQPNVPFVQVIDIPVICLILLDFQIGICSHYLTRLNSLERWLSVADGIIMAFSLGIDSYLMLAIGIAIFAAMTIHQLMRKRGMSSISPASSAGQR